MIVFIIIMGGFSNLFWSSGSSVPLLVLAVQNKGYKGNFG